MNKIMQKEYFTAIKKAKAFDILMKNFNILIEDTFDEDFKIITIGDSDLYDRVSEVYSTNDARILSFIIRSVKGGE